MTADNSTGPSPESSANPTARREITIVNELGLHARPAAEFCIAAKGFRSQVWLVKGSERFSAASILEVLSADLNCGETAVIEAEGPDAEEAVQRLAELSAAFGTNEPETTKKFRRAEEDF